MKGIMFCGHSLDVIRHFPTPVKREAGYQLDRLQRGLDPNDWKPMTSIGKGVREIRIQEQGQYRIIYIARLEDAVYVLHAFAKKTRKTRKSDIDMAKREFKALLERYLK